MFLLYNKKSGSADRAIKMAMIANKYAKKVYLTDDNPRNENPSKIRKNILWHLGEKVVLEM